MARHALDIARAHAGLPLAMAPRMQLPSWRLALASLALSACVVPSALVSVHRAAPPPDTDTDQDPPVEVYHQADAPVLVGLSVAAAEARAKEHGWIGTFEVHEQPYDAACAAGTVCSIRPERWDWEIGSTDTIDIYVNPTLTLAAPPPP
jgi:hypothetical protein